MKRRALVALAVVLMAFASAVPARVFAQEVRVPEAGSVGGTTEIWIKGPQVPDDTPARQQVGVDSATQKIDKDATSQGGKLPTTGDAVRATLLALAGLAGSVCLVAGIVRHERR